MGVMGSWELPHQGKTYHVAMKLRRSPGVFGDRGFIFLRPRMRLWGKGRVSETREGMRCSSLNAMSSLDVPLAQQDEVRGRPYGKPRRLNTPGP